MSFQYTSIGVIKTPFKQKFVVPRQANLSPSTRGTIQLDTKAVPQGALQGLEGFSHLWVLFDFHLNTNKTISGKIFPPRLDEKKWAFLQAAPPIARTPLDFHYYTLKTFSPDTLEIKVSGVDICR